MSVRNLFLFVVLLTALAMLAACQSEKADRQPLKFESVELSKHVVLDFDSLPTQDGRTPLTDVLELASESASWNFTYAEATGRGLAATEVPVSGTEKVRRKELEALLGELLAEHGFALERVGPADLRTWLVEPLAGGPREASLEVFPLQHITAEEALAECRAYEGERPVTVAPEARTNALLVYASAPDLEGIRTLLASIDVAPDDAR